MHREFMRKNGNNKWEIDTEKKKPKKVEKNAEIKSY